MSRERRAQQVSLKLPLVTEEHTAKLILKRRTQVPPEQFLLGTYHLKRKQQFTPVVNPHLKDDL